ncbi:PH domain-containing protein [Flavobacterium sp. GT3R68]|uniref:PH domain-containing protein n=1 Tax=Flavobacterium sp. GT3R68 TaxID=2594437 RepID=UPI000F880B78|nr:PH domain-containing protein [Flavobacterium sp. GT3R68]RTY95009.1 hypothetical protein EKL32_08815 [Flavobacterium sp. GSN2]TRW91814.1 hypothetical protein FNW07_07990 [Flavobacterium sp. GT3R68]
MKTFVSSKNWFTVGVFWALVAFLSFAVIIPKNDNDLSVYIGYAIIIPIIVCLVWVLCDTKYVIKDKWLHYYFGPFRGKIEITKITEMKYHSSWIIPVTFKPGLGTPGFIISYNKFDDIYISPKDLKEFEEVLLSINPAIKING